MISRFVCVSFGAAVITGCASAVSPSLGPANATLNLVSPVAHASVVARRPNWYRQAPRLLRSGVYIAQYYASDILAYDSATRKDRPRSVPFRRRTS
jgi:hypothetical protein